MEKRVVKIPVPVELISRMDEALAAGRGGLQTREQFFREAAEGLLADISYEEAPAQSSGADVGQGLQGSDGSIGRMLERVPAWEREELQLADLVDSRLSLPGLGVDIRDGVVEAEKEPMLGLHNRDYPSLWAASRLARYTTDDAILFDDFRRRVTLAAWYFGMQLSSLSPAKGSRLTALFPTNPHKPESAERAFQNFAVGSVPKRLPSSGPIKASGPLFVWQLCQLQRRDGEIVIGLTPAGRSLLEELAGVSLQLPHEPDMADRFLLHVFKTSPGDRWGFERILDVVSAGPDREEVVSAISADRPEWTVATASSVAQGYVARSREWGLLQPRLDKGRYRLTPLGEKWQAYCRASEKNREAQR